MVVTPPASAEQTGLRANQLKALMSAIDETVLLLDRTGAIVEASETAIHRLGGTREGLLGVGVWDVLPEEAVSTRQAAFQEVLETGAPVKTEDVGSGERRFQTTWFPVVDEQDRVDQVAVFGRDITRAVELSEEKYRDMVEQINDVIYSIDRDGRITYVSPAAREVLGYEPSELAGREYSELIDPRDLPGVRAAWEEVLEGRLHPGEHRMRNRSGSAVWVRTSSRPVLEGGRVVGVRGVLSDISQRKRAEKALRENEEVMRYIIKHDPNAVAVYDRDLRYIAVSDRYLKDYGVSRSDVLGRHHHEVFPETPQRWQDVYQRVLQGATERNDDDSFERPDGSVTYNRWECRPWYTADGDIGGMITYTEVTTERKMAELALQESEQKFRSITEQSSDLIALTDLDGVITYASPSAVQVFAAAPEEMVGRDFTAFLDASAVPAAMQAFRECIEKGRAVKHLQLLMQRSDGQRFHGELSGSYYASPSFQGTLVVIRDLSERKRLEEEIRHADKMKAIGTLAGGIAHDFNNILGIIVGNTELALADLPSWSPVRENLSEVRLASLRARDLVKQILLFARQKQHDVAPVRVEPVAEESLRMVRASIPSAVEIRPDIEVALPPVLADPSQIQQIVLNLCTNAGQAMETEGGVLWFGLDSVRLDSPLATATGRIPEGRYVRVQVCDTGPGIPPDHLESIFEPFFTTKDVGRGAGLGLAVVHGIVQERRGGITAKSEEGKGALFTVYLPALEDEPEAEATEIEAGLPRGTERILFVDDEPMIMRLGRRMLERQGYDVEAYGNGAEALEAFNQDPDSFDLVVTDMAMPGMRGDRLAVAISAVRPDIPVILTTGYSDQICEEKARSIGIREFVLKPLTQHELATKVREILDEQG
jgi:PAS domain S-box-containing protein